jgi:hypothetical protein
MYCVKIWIIAIAIFQAKIIVDTACVKQKYIDVLLQNLLLAWQNYSMLIGWEEYNQCCYIASVNAKRDWLICSHVALDKCNVSRPGNKWKIVARPDRLRT